MDFFVDESIKNFIEPPPDKLPAMEQVRSDRFSIKQLRTLVGELEELAKEFGDGEDGIPNKVMAELFLRKLENSKTLQDDGSLPEQWWSLTAYDFQTLIRNLDRTGLGTVNWKQLATFIILLKTALPSEADLESLKQAFGGHMLSLEAFTTIRTWFDEAEDSQDRHYSIPFHRLQQIKSLLFKVNREHALSPE